MTPMSCSFPPPAWWRLALVHKDLGQSRINVMVSFPSARGHSGMRRRSAAAGRHFRYLTVPGGSASDEGRRQDGYVFKAETLDELAQVAGVDVDRLLNTIRLCNVRFAVKRLIGSDGRLWLTA
jgi:hypothetical protein